ncbi:MAG: winged helix-turn-helix domain-containing protein [Promethearchaeota archaeon]
MTKDRQKLFEYWKNLPASKFVNVSKEKYYSHPVRRDIIRLLRKGIDEESPDGNFQVRRALNVSEIKRGLMKDIKLSKSTLYFHLDVLVELGLIKLVAILHEGPYRRNKTKYFGRTARNLFITSSDDSIENYKEQFEEFQKFADIIGFKLPDNYPEIPKRYIDSDEHFFRIFGKWLLVHEEIIDEKRLSMGLLYEFLKCVNSIHPTYVQLLNELFQTLQHNIQEL